MAAFKFTTLGPRWAIVPGWDPLDRLPSTQGRKIAPRICTLGGLPKFEHYAYDEAGQRSEKTRTGYGASVMEHRRYVDASYEVDVVAGTHQLHLFVGARRVATARRSGLGTDTDRGTTQDVIFYHPDHVGSNTVLTDASGQIVQETFLTPFGTSYAMLDGQGQPVAPANTATPYLFTDQERDANTGLDDFGARSYDPIVGRFLSQDPELIGAGSGVTFGRIEGDGQNLNAYTYVLNRPTRLVDPSGRFADLTISMVDWDGRNTSYFFTASSAVSAGLGTANTAAGAMAINNVMTGGNLGSPGSAGGTGAAPATGGAAGAAAGQQATAASQSGAASQQSGGFWSRTGDTLNRWLVGEIGGAIRAPFTHISRGLSNIYGGIRGMISGTPGSLKQVGAGLAELVLGTPFPAINNNGGLFWTGPSLGDKNSYAADGHDIGMNQVGPPGWLNPAPMGWRSSGHTFQYITDSFTGPGFQPGPYGQADRIAGAVGFGAYGSLLFLAGQ